MNDDVVTMFRPTGPKELELVAESGWRRWPPRLPGQPIFYPVTNREYAEQIARDWNVPESGAGFVTKFNVRRQFVERFETHQVGGSGHTEWWIPAEDLEELNDNIVGRMSWLRAFRPASRRQWPAPKSAVAPDVNRCPFASRDLYSPASRFTPVNRKR